MKKENRKTKPTVDHKEIKTKKPFLAKEQWKKLGLILGGIGVLILLIVFLVYPRIVFSQFEKRVEKAANRYYEVNYNVLKKDGVHTLSLQTLYKQKYVEDLKTPFSKDSCSLKESWVKTEVKKGTTKQYVYLHCGRFSSSVDHEGPIITLNGKQEITVEKGSAYEEEGVKSVVDQNDGTMDIKSVTVQNKVDTSKVGTYKVIYKAKDKLLNEGVTERVVKVVETLNHVVTTVTNGQNYYQGNVTNNYVLFSGMLWRIVGLNEDGNIKLITDQPVGTMSCESKDGSFENSDIKKWLNEYFYNHLNKESKKYMTDQKVCTDVIGDLSTTTCSTWSDKKYTVSLLSLPEYNLSGGGSGFGASVNGTWLLNKTNENILLTYMGRLFYPTNMVNTSSLYGVRPLIVLKKNTNIIAGNGTENNPYRIGDYKQGKKKELLNTRIVGEYLTYSGYSFRITEVDKTGVTAIMNGSVNLGVDNMISYQDDGDASIYDPTKKGNIGEKIENDGKKFVSTKLLQKQKIEVSIYDDMILYGQEKEKKSYEVYLAAPSIFTMFANMPNQGYYNYWYRDSSKNQEYRYQMLYDGNVFHYISKDMVADMRLEVKFKNDVKIADGNGTRNDPYKIS